MILSQIGDPGWLVCHADRYQSVNYLVTANEGDARDGWPGMCRAKPGPDLTRSGPGSDQIWHHWAGAPSRWLLAQRTCHNQHSLHLPSWQPHPTNGTDSLLGHNAQTSTTLQALTDLCLDTDRQHLTGNPGCCPACLAGLVEKIPFANISSMLNPTAFPNAEDLAANTSLGNLIVLSGT